MHLIGLARLGRDAELRHLPDGTPAVGMALAYNYGAKQGDGNRLTQWVDATWFGERAEKLLQYLLKGQQVEVHIADIHVEEFTRRDGSAGVKLIGTLRHLDFGASPAGSQGQGQGQRAPAQQQGRAPQNSRPAQNARPASNYADMDDDIPFN